MTEREKVVIIGAKTIPDFILVGNAVETFRKRLADGHNEGEGVIYTTEERDMFVRVWASATQINVELRFEV